MPSIESALTEEQILARLETLAGDAGYRQRVGAASRDWIVRRHGWEVCAGEHLAVYQDIFTRRGLTPLPTEAAPAAAGAFTT